MTGKYLTSFQRKLLENNLEKAETYLPENLRKRIQIMLYADEGRSQAEICQILKCSAATARVGFGKPKVGWRINGKNTLAVVLRLLKKNI
jgi:hypothetical protein